jgi:hypothetical protein
MPNLQLADQDGLENYIRNLHAELKQTQEKYRKCRQEHLTDRKVSKLER